MKLPPANLKCSPGGIEADLDENFRRNRRNGKNALCHLFAASVVASEETQVSDLFGRAAKNGQLSADCRMWLSPGIFYGERPIPDVPVTANVHEFGAKGDGKADDTAAFERAIAEAPEGAILVPAGRYRLTGRVAINRKNIVLRGEGADKTTLFFERSLDEVEPNMSTTTEGRPTSRYSWSGGLLKLDEEDKGKELAKITAGAKRGDRSCEISSTDQLQVGQTVKTM